MDFLSFWDTPTGPDFQTALVLNSFYLVTYKNVSFIKTLSTENSGNTSEKLFTSFECLKESWTFWKILTTRFLVGEMEAVTEFYSSIIFGVIYRMYVYVSTGILNIWYFVALASSILFKQRKYKIKENADLFVPRECTAY